MSKIPITIKNNDKKIMVNLGMPFYIKTIYIYHEFSEDVRRSDRLKAFHWH